MPPWTRALRRFWRDEGGVTSIEYALMASLVAMAIIVGVTLLGEQVQALYQRVLDCMLSPATCT